MKATTACPPKFRTVGDLLRHLGGIPAARVRWEPTPGTATERDLLRACVERPCELVDGVLVEKAMGFQESILAGFLCHCMWKYLESNNLGIVAGEQALIRVRLGQVRAPDACFYFWTRFPRRRVPKQAILKMVPDWAIEVLSRGNTRIEMQRKRREYFRGGVRLVWEVDLRRRTITAYTSLRDKKVYTDGDTITADEVLPGFSLSVREFFDRAEGPGE